jgi:uncharacterized membrane protein
MARHEKLLKQWVANQLITESQAEAIRKFESDKPSSLFFWFVALGAGVIGLGCISVIAANWKAIPDSLKLLMDFSILFATGGYAAKEAKGNHPLRYEGVLIFLLIFTLASIGLVSQVFHTDGHLYQALLFWAMITSGVMLSSRKLVVPFAWTTGLFTGVLVFLFTSPWGRKAFQDNPGPVIASLPFVAALFAILSRAFLGERPQTKAFRIWVVLLAIGGLFFTEVGFPYSLKKTSSFHLEFYVAGLAALAIGWSGEYRMTQKILLWLASIIYVIPFQFPWLLGEIQLPVFRGALHSVTTILALGVFAVFCATIESKKLVQLSLNLIALRFLILYFQALGGLATTGVGLIVSGALIIGLVWVWKKKKKAIEGFVEGLVR